VQSGGQRICDVGIYTEGMLHQHLCADGVAYKGTSQQRICEAGIYDEGLATRTSATRALPRSTLRQAAS
jgi:hypothetical protein